jgi:hypothetical protein
LTSVTRRNSAGVVSSAGANTDTIASFTQMSSCPHSATTRSAAANTAGASLTSSGSTSASEPALRTSAAAASKASSVRAMSATFAPCRANSRAIARPTPDDAPVIAATFPFSNRSPLAMLIPCAEHAALGRLRGAPLRLQTVSQRGMRCIAAVMTP